MRYGEDDWRRDAPFWAIAALFHAALFSTNPGMRWGLAKAAAAKPIPVEFVTLPLSAIGAQVPGDGSANLPGLGLGEYQPEKRGPAAPPKAAPKKARRKPVVAKRVKAAKAVAVRAVRRPDPAAARAAFERKLAARDRQARLAMARAELAAKAAADRAAAAEAARQAALAKAQARAEALEAAKQAALRRAQAEAARRAARTAKAAELSRALAAMPAPDSELRDAVSGVVPAGKAKISTGEHAAALAATADAEVGDAEDGDEPAYAADSVRRTGKDAYSAAASGGGLGQGGGAGAASFSLDGPIGSRKLLRRVLPDSPEWVAQRSLDLTVAIRFQVLADGSVRTGAVIAKTSGFPDLDRRALQAIRGWRFQAAAGAAPVWGSVKFRFTN